MINSLWLFLSDHGLVVTAIFSALIAAMQLRNYIKQKHDRAFKKAQKKLMEKYKGLISHDTDYIEFASIANNFPKSSKYIIRLLQRFNKTCIENPNHKYIEAIISIANNKYNSTSIPAFKEYKHIIPITILMTMRPPVSLRFSMFFSKTKLYIIYIFNKTIQIRKTHDSLHIHLNIPRF